MMPLVDTYKHKGMRRAMLNTLPTKAMVGEKVLAAMEKVPRHFFFESAFLEQAYMDKAFSIGEKQTISQPSTVALQTALLAVEQGNKILEIGTGSGYQSCVLLELGAKLYTIEYNRILYQKARALLKQMHYDAHFVCGDGSEGLPTFAPYDRILVTAAAPKVPQVLVEQLKNGGILVIPVGSTTEQEMYKLTKNEQGEVTVQTYDKFRFVPLLGKEGWK
jgi:protein-L-isoaspartate(D-aspartate) O-methyltransferase